jgi:16S rRNA (guanine527-N7)-methyltransferase
MASGIYNVAESGHKNTTKFLWVQVYENDSEIHALLLLLPVLNNHWLMELIKKYFPALDQSTFAKLSNLMPLYADWNRKINLISRKDFDFFFERHVLHSLAIAAIVKFPSGSKVLDAGTGGGFPGIPLAIIFPDVHFHLVDSIRKKITAVEDIVRQLGLNNVAIDCSRIEKLDSSYNYVVSRAVAPLQQMIEWTSHLLVHDKKKEPRPGILYLKGGEVEKELKNISWLYRLYTLNSVFSEPFFETKVLVHLYQ